LITGVNPLAVVVAAIAAVILSTAWYSPFAKQLASLNAAYAEAAGSRPEPWKVLVELVRSLVLATVMAGLAVGLDIDDWTGALLFALCCGSDFRSCSGPGPWSGNEFPSSSLPSTAGTGF
jgi:Protein of unknown function (DUF1761)